MMQTIKYKWPMPSSFSGHIQSLYIDMIKCSAGTNLMQGHHSGLVFALQSIILHLFDLQGAPSKSIYSKYLQMETSKRTEHKPNNSCEICKLRITALRKAKALLCVQRTGSERSQ